MYRKSYTKRFLKSFKKIIRSGKVERQEIEYVVDLLALGSKMPAEYKDHQLKGDKNGYRECHIRGNLLLMYKIDKGILVLILVDIGSHPQLLNM